MTTALDRMADARDPLSARLAALAGISEATGGEVTLDHEPFLAQVNLRLDPSLSGLTPFPLPAEPNTAWEGDDRSALWLGPDEWLILGPPHTGADLADELSGLLADVHHSAVDVSANRVALRLSGPGVAEVLSKGCSLDLHTRSWRPGLCAQTLLGKAQVIVHERRESTRILVRTSFADYLVDWFVAATR